MKYGQYPVRMTRKPRIGNFKELKFKKIPGGAYPRTRLDACAFGARLGNRSLFILDPRLNRLTTVKLFRLNLGYPISPKHPKSFQSSTQQPLYFGEELCVTTQWLRG